PCSIIYYFSMESFTGKTVGKMITKTRVVSTNGNQASVLSILIRTLVRVFPLFFVTVFSSSKGLHDIFSKTKVVSSVKQNDL
ncbi:MAG: RDD family protein, partial [Bacteroidota bacterium]